LATCTYLVDEQDAARAAGGGRCRLCLFATARDPDGTVLLVVDR
jgi:hypothetical protein